MNCKFKIMEGNYSLDCDKIKGRGNAFLRIFLTSMTNCMMKCITLITIKFDYKFSLY